MSQYVAYQVALLPSYTNSLYCCKSGFSAPFLQQWGHSQHALLTACSNIIIIFLNLFDLFLNLFAFLSKKRGHVTQLLGQFESAAIFPYWSHIHTSTRCFTNYIISFLSLLLPHPQVFTWVLQPELLFKIVIFGKASPTYLATRRTAN